MTESQAALSEQRRRGQVGGASAERPQRVPDALLARRYLLITTLSALCFPASAKVS
jgi:hypothetical protein